MSITTRKQRDPFSKLKNPKYHILNPLEIHRPTATYTKNRFFCNISVIFIHGVFNVRLSC